MKKKSYISKTDDIIEGKISKSQEKIDWFDSWVKESYSIEKRLEKASLLELKQLLRETETKLLFLKDKINPYPEDGLAGSPATIWEYKNYWERKTCESKIFLIKSKINEKQR